LLTFLPLLLDLFCRPLPHQAVLDPASHTSPELVPKISGSGQLPDALSGIAILPVLYYCIEKHCPGLCCFCFFLILLFLPIFHPVFSSVLIFFILSCPQLLILSFPCFVILSFPHLLNPVFSTTSLILFSLIFLIGSLFFFHISSFTYFPHSAISYSSTSRLSFFPLVTMDYYLISPSHYLLTVYKVRVERSVFLSIRCKRTGRVLFFVTAMYCLKF
jgi:hypothetical protein